VPFTQRFLLHPPCVQGGSLHEAFVVFRFGGGFVVIIAVNRAALPFDFCRTMAHFRDRWGPYAAMPLRLHLGLV
jgi:hypothetical protein